MGALITIINVIYLVVRPDILPISELLVITVIAYLLSAIFSAVYIPFQLKYGAEKGRIVLVALGGIIFAVAILMKHIGPLLASMTGGFVTVFAVVSNLTSGILILGTLMITVLSVFISMKISIRILEKEEY